MKKLVCHIVDRNHKDHIGVDQFLAECFGWTSDMGDRGMNPYKVAGYRSLYDSEHKEPLIPNDVVNPTEEQLFDAFEKLIRYKRGTEAGHRRDMAKAQKNTVKAYDRLKHAFNYHDRHDYIDYITTLFSMEVDRLQKGNTGVSRQAIVEGFRTVDGEVYGGTAAILEAVYNQLLAKRSLHYSLLKENELAWNNIQKRITAAKQEGAKHPEDRYMLEFSNAPKNATEYATLQENYYNEITKVIENWNEFLPLVMRNLVKKEGIKLNVKQDYVTAASTDNYDADSVAAKWDISESVRDGWMRNNDSESSYAEMDQAVRRFLSCIYETEEVPNFVEINGVQYRKGTKVLPVYNKLGTRTFKDPVQVHQYLSEYFRGIQTQEDLMKRLVRPGTDRARISWMQPLVDIVTSNPKLATKLFVDFKHNFQPYSVVYEMEEKSEGRIKKWGTSIINKAKNLLSSKYEISFTSKNGKHPVNVKVWGYEPIFEEGAKGGKVNWQRLAELRQLVLKWTHEEKIELPGVFNGRKQYDITPALLTNRSNKATINIDGETKRLTYDMKRDFLMEVFTSLGFDVTCDAIDDILNSPAIYKVREQLEQLFNPDDQKTGITYAISIGDNKKKFLKLTDSSVSEEEKQNIVKELSNYFRNFNRLYNAEVRKDSKENPATPVKEHITSLLNIISASQEGKKLESRARYQDNTIFSFVNPCYLGDRLEKIESYVNENDHEGLLNFIKDEYLQSPFFVDDEYIATKGKKGKILNLWLADLVDACKSKRRLAETVAKIFKFERDLGREDKKFEDFTIKEHGQDMLLHFWADEQSNKGYDNKSTKDERRKLSALYPIFVLGDAGVSKYIRAPRITSAYRVDEHGNDIAEGDYKTAVKRIDYRFDEAAKDRVIDSFYDLYVQEHRRMELEKGMTFPFSANGKEVKHLEGEYSFLTFLNPSSSEYISDYEIPADKVDDKAYVKDVIKKYLENATLKNVKRADGTIIPSFKQRLTDMGLLETEKNRKKQDAYVHLNSVMTPQNIDSKLTEFYWNTMLATAMQMQFLTIDPWFYDSTKTLQKRFKEVHAPGRSLDILALDFKGKRYSEDGVETCVYFKDLKLNAEETNPEFMEAILRTFALEGADVDAAIADGILKPAVTDSEKTIKHNKLINLLGNEIVSRIYEPYMNNTLTDGQGYRSLTSYRKVMGMYGKWTEDMESAYDYIKEIRAKHKEDGKPITSEEMKKIADFALVLQPIKPYMFTHERVQARIQKTNQAGTEKLKDDSGNPIYEDTIMYVPVQHKYAEALIIPELLPEGNKLRDLGLWMEDNDVDLVGSDKICKVGCWGETDFSEVTDKKSLHEALSKAKVHRLDYKDYRVQTNVPEHINVSRLFGTQIRKLIMAGLRAGHTYSNYLNVDKINLSTDGVNNKECSLTGHNILALFNSLICANIMDSYDRFENNATDIDTIAEMLQQSTAGNSRESMDNLFSYLVTGNEEESKKFAISLFEGGLEHDSAALILSTFKKIVNKQQISGGSAVQVSAFGINGYSKSGDLRYVQDPDNKNNILYAEIEMPFDKSTLVTTTDANGKTSTHSVNLDYDKYCFMDGNLKPSGKALEKGSKEFKKYLSYTYKEVNGELVPCSHEDPNAKVYKPLIEKEYPNILNIIAYRIPTESNYSMLNCQVKRFTSKMAGGTLKVPSQGTTIAGFDFDIDKLYFMQREYHKKFKSSAYVESKFSDDAKNKIWQHIYENNEHLDIELENARYDAEKEHNDFKHGYQTTKNSYYDKINGKSITGKSKSEIFKEAAEELGIEPTVNLTREDKSEDVSTYDFTKSPEENHRSSINNLLIDLMQARLMDPETMKQRYTPGGFEEAKDAARFLRELLYGNLDSIVNGDEVDLETLRGRKGNDNDPEPNYSVIDPYTMLYYNQQNQLAAKLIGIFANQNTHTAFVSCMNKFELNKPISFCGHDYNDLLHKDKPEAVEASLRVAQFLAASVDAVKDPVLNYMNLNTLTADSAALLARLGYTMEEIGLFLSQPIIVDICQNTFNSGKNIHTCINEMKKVLKKDIKGDPSSKKSPSANELALSIIKNRQSKEKGEEHKQYLKEDARSQYAVLEIFSDILKAAQDVSDFVTNTKFTASNAVGSTFGSLYAQQLKVDSYVDKFNKDNKKTGSEISYTLKVVNTADGKGFMNKPIDNNPALLNMSKQEYLRHVRFNPFAFEQCMFDTNRKAINALSKYYPYETDLYKGVRRIANEMARYGHLSEDDINALHSCIPVALLAKQKFSDFYGEGLHMVRNSEGNYVKTNITNREYYREQFAGDLEKILGDYPELTELDIFKYMIPSSKTVVCGKEDVYENGNFKYQKDITKDVWTITMQDVGGMNSEIKEVIKESWESLLEVDDDGNYKNPKFAELGKDLFMYCFYQMGFQFSPISFMHLSPTEVKKAITIDLGDRVSINSFEEGGIDIESDHTDDVLVWSANTPGVKDRLIGEYNVDDKMIGELQGNTFRIGDELNHKEVLWLVNAAISHPELKFKIDRTLTQEEFDLFSRESLGKNCPSNIYFSKKTLDNVEKGGVAESYGRTISYAQFLDRILQGKENLDINDFMKQWILNHPDNSRFIFDINKGEKDFVAELKKQAEESLKTNRDTILFDVSSFTTNKKEEEDVDPVSSLVKIQMSEEGKIMKASWAPCILYKGSYYMADNGEEREVFNENGSTMMTYKKVAPLGTSKKITYDGGKDLTASMRFQSYLGEEGEDPSHAEYKREVTPARTETEEKGEGEGENPPTSGTEVSDVRLENRDTSNIVDTFNAIKKYAEDNNIEVSDWNALLDNLLDLDLRNQVLNEENPYSDTVYDVVDGIMGKALGRRNWARYDNDLKDALVYTIFEYNKNPTYLEPESSVNAEGQSAERGDVSLGALRETYEKNILSEFLKALDKEYTRLGLPIHNKADEENFLKIIKTKSDKDIAETVASIMTACREDGVIVLDENGNPKQSC